MSDYLQAALDYAKRGWSVFPCHPDTKQPLLKADVDPNSGEPIRGTGGLKKATTDPVLITEYWKRWPRACIAIPTGDNIGAFVIDLDGGTDEETGEQFTAARLKADLEAAVGVTLPKTWMYATPRGGWHMHFGCPQGTAMPKNRVAIVPRVDVRGVGGYVIVPPSKRGDGREYRWIIAPDQLDLAIAPPELISFLDKETLRNTQKPSAMPRSSAGSTGGADFASYGIAALRSEIDQLRSAQPGTRNNTLYKSSLNLGSLVAAGALSQARVEDELENVVRGWDDIRKSRGTIASGLSAGLSQPRDLSHLNRTYQADPVEFDNGAIGFGETEHAAPLDENDRALDAELSLYPLTDLGNAERFKARMQSRFIWSGGKPLHWDGTIWCREGAEENVATAEHHVARSIQREAKWLKNSGKDWIAEVKYKGTKAEECFMHSDRLYQWGRQSEDIRRLAAISKRAAPMMAQPSENLDANPHKINVKNGTIVFCPDQKGPAVIQFRPHNPDDLITKKMNVVYDPEAQCPVYDDFLAKVQPDPEVRRFLHQWAGYCLTGLMTEQLFVFFWGKGRNGKTTLVEIYAFIFGGFACAIPVETFVDTGKQRGAGQASPDLAMLRSIRLVHTDEPDRYAKLAEGTLKRITGGDTLRVRDLHRTYFDLRPECKIIISGNHRPRIDGGEASQGIWRRLLFVHWPYTIPISEIDKSLPSKLRAEHSGIFNRMLEGLRDWHQHGGFVIPDEIANATEVFRAESDVLGSFLADCTMDKVGSVVSATDLHDVLAAWMSSHREKPWSAKALGSAMRERGYTQIRNSQRLWKDLALTKTKDDFEPSPPDQPTGVEYSDEVPF